MIDQAIYTDVRAELVKAQALLTAHGLESSATDATSWMSLLETLKTCRSLLDACQPLSRRVLRSIHHLACSGGSIITRCIASMPNVVALSEVDPLSPLPLGASPFRPSDLIFLAGRSPRRPSDEVLLEVFFRGLEALQHRTFQNGQSLLLRDHSHSKYTLGECVQERPSVHNILSRKFQMRSVVTVRHPLDSYQGLIVAGWLHFQPTNFEEYCRRILLFLDDHDGIELMRYEDFVLDPVSHLRYLCSVLELGWHADALKLNQATSLSGNSGRQGLIIAPRPRRPVSPELALEAAGSASYAALCARLKYNSDPEADPILG